MFLGFLLEFLDPTGLVVHFRFLEFNLHMEVLLLGENYSFKSLKDFLKVFLMSYRDVYVIGNFISSTRTMLSKSSTVYFLRYFGIQSKVPLEFFDYTLLKLKVTNRG